MEWNKICSIRLRRSRTMPRIVVDRPAQVKIVMAK